MTPRSPRKPQPAGAPAPAADPGAAPDDVAALPFEAALSQLEQIVGELEEGALPLEEALARFERGIHLSRHLEKQLRAAEVRVRKLVGGEPGEPLLTALDASADVAAGVPEEGLADGGGDEAYAGGDAGEVDDGEDDAGSDRLF
jgi:exodeoxyribonuclease VII small subunit